MATETFFKLSQDGDLEGIRSLFENENSIDINAKDVHAMSALAYSARNGHIEIVRELLQRGAEKQEVVEQGYGLNNEEIAKLLQDGDNQQQSENNDQQNETYMPVDMHGGQQLPDGTISYMNASSNFGQGYGFPPPQFGGPQFPHQFFPVEEMHAGAPIFQPGSANGNNRRNHARKESGINLPPPEVARMIPCKYFPNCKYGEKCVFAHPIPMGALPLPPQGHPLSPSASQPPQMQPMFYGQIPPGYPYPPYGGVPQQFLPSGTPMGPPESMQHFGDVAQSFGGPQMVHTPHQQSQYPHSAPVEGTEFNVENGEEKRAEGESNGQVNEIAGEERVQANGEAGIDGQADPSSSTGFDNNEDSASSATANGKPLHRRQSFNSFLHHHAVPFQPQSMAGLDMNNTMMNGITNGFVPRSAMQMQGKGRRMNGNNLNGNFSGKRVMLNGDRPPCTFFQSGRCKYGNDCRFPHLLPDGSDVRSAQAQQKQNTPTQASNGTASEVSTPNISNEQPIKADEPLAESTTAVTPTTGNANAPVSAPTAPQADKRAAQQQSQQSQQSQSQSQNTSQKQSQGSGSQQNHGNGKNNNKSSGQSNGIVRSNPSKTSIQANGQNNNNHGGSGSRGNKKNNQNNNNQQQNQKPSQRVPTVNDFPALSSPNPNGSNATSPLPSSANAALVNGNSNNHVTNGASSSSNAVHASSSTPASPAVPIKANFSAILSAPAPVKPVKSESAVNGTTNDANSSVKSDEAPTTNGKVESEETNGGAKSTAAQVAKTHASVAAAAAAASAPVVNGTVNGTTVTKAQQTNSQPKTNGRSNNEKKEKQNNKQQAQKAAAAAAPAKTNGTNPVTEMSDDDFQLVNRSRHSSHKRPSNGNGNNSKTNEAYAPQAKAVVA